MSSESKSKREPRSWLETNLTALGSAAVLAVYAAGFERTRAAAAHFDEPVVRRPAPPAHPTGEIAAQSPRPTDSVGGPRIPHVVAAPAAETPETPAKKASKPSVPPVAQPVAQPLAQKKTETVAAAPVQAPRPARDSVVPAPTPAPQPAMPVEAAPVAVAVPAPAPKPAPVAGDTTQPTKELVRKDGTYTGWGTSRHGDVQTTIQIKDGKIVFAAISECLTRYPCSWIAALPGQVIARQSADVDFVSGATESANAFYSAVFEALTKSTK
ncbi:MAG: hypothetical protein ACREPM_02350 [Gemmatimonadaceae bacterium]